MKLNSRLCNVTILHLLLKAKYEGVNVPVRGKPLEKKANIFNKS